MPGPARTRNRQHRDTLRPALEYALLSTLLAGIVVGAAHAVTGPDHVAAVVPLSLTDRRRGLLTGLAWGAGHGAGIAALTLLAVLMRDLLHVQIVGAWAEAFVGVVLVAMGLWIAIRPPGLRLHPPHDHDQDHDHHHPAPLLHPPHRHVHQVGAAFGIGTLHGSAGMGHLVGVIPAMGMPTSSAIVYLLSLVLGAAGAMGLVGFAAGALSGRATDRWRRNLALIAGAAAVLIGVIWLARAIPALA